MAADLATAEIDAPAQRVGHGRSVKATVTAGQAVTLRG